ncbi:DUF6913 domain-containing protein [Polaribacter sp. Hel1_85]|uniref:DUF6913 domain-containing protein n=1 Tax=Polaribacter sp. Hel1_85 TaxID=1250005 RepID=UPI00052CC6A0|nr:hypothetical protein [Polaribacter sp. Hel1_85]KGL63073.1 hypothetical protein PHEL85_0104 [Polaribacter sp. Hel1_85]
MNLSKLKEVRLKKKFDKILSNLSENRTVSQKEIQSVGILSTEEISSKIELESKVEAILGVRNSKIYSYKKFDKSDAISYKHFSEKDINWKGDFVEPTFQSFLEQPFDLLIGYFNENHLYLEHAVLKSKATFKAGFSEVNSKLYELEISTELENVQQFSSELKKYLQILKKLKN